MEGNSTLWPGLLCLLLYLNPFSTSGQDFSFSLSVPTDVEVCGDQATFGFSFTNEASTPLSNLSIDIALPNGLVYEGDFSESSAFNVQAQSTSNSRALTFTANPLPAGQTISFTFSASADFTAMSRHKGGSVFRNSITVNYGSGSAESGQSSAYNIIYPALSIIDVNSVNRSAYVGEVFTRDVTIINGGYGKLSTFTLKDIRSGGLDLTATSLGVIGSGNDEIVFSASDFTGTGNGDGWLDRNESITVTQTFQVIGCSDISSEIYAVWGCDGQTENSNNEFPYTTVSLFLPDLNITPTVNFNTCITGSPDAQALTLTNNGNGPANNLQVQIEQNNDPQFSRLDIGSIQYQVNGGAWTSISPSSSANTTNTEEYACLGADAKKRFTLDLPNLPPGDTYAIIWNSYTCPTDFCGALDLIGWKYKVTYEDACQSNDYSDSATGQETKDKSFSFFVENPADLSNGQVGGYNFILSSATLNLPEGNNPYFEAQFDIPAGLDWSGNSNDLVFRSGANTWTPSSVNYNSGVLTARYALPIPFTLTRSEFNLQLTANCSNGSDGAATVGMQLFYGMDDSCSPPYTLPLSCYETAETYLHCPGPCGEGLAFQSFSPQRTSLGQADNDQDGLPDAAGSLDFNRIQRQRVMVGDTFSTTFIGTVKTSSSYPSWSYGYASTNIPNGAYLTLLDARVEVYDQSTGQTLTCESVGMTSSTTSTLKADFDFSVATLVANGCSTFSNFEFGEGDQITLVPRYQVTSNIGGAVEQIAMTNSFYLSDIANPTNSANQFQCDSWAGNLTMIGYYFKTESTNNYSVNGCDKRVEQSYLLSIGDCCTNYAGGDLFPFEYRHWAIIKDLTVTIPTGYAVTEMWMEQNRTTSTNNKQKETQNSISPTSVVGNTYTFDLSQYLVENGGNINRSDDGFDGKVYLRLDPECNLTTGVNENITWDYYFQEADILSGNVTSVYSGTDRIKYNRGDITVSSTQQTKNGIETTVSWDIKVKNSSNRGNAENAWVHFYAPSWDIDVIEVMDLSNNSVLSKQGDFYQLGDIAKNKTKNYRVTATYDRCTIDELKVYTGYNCDAYPTTFAGVTCPYNEYSLFVDPQEAGMQVRIDGSAEANDPCSPIVSTSIDILSSKLGYVKELWVEVDIPATQSILLVEGSVQKEYPIGSTKTTLGTPTLQGTVYRFATTDLDATIAASGLVGVSDITANEISLDFNLELQNNFENGERVEIRVGGLEACGDTLSTVTLQYDPNAVFGQLVGVGLDEAENSWGAAWGDYDNDGDPDLFVTNYEIDEPNQLYRNNGDGSFTLITTGSIVTDRASSIAASWGDYDNDGDLDLYVTNNIGYENFLYRNNGDGSFTSVLGDPIVNERGYSHGVSWGDYDNDGHLDLFVAEFFATRFNLLYHNNGDGTFTKVLTNVVSQEASSSVAGVWGDYDNDGDLDLFVANTNDENNHLYRNDGNGVFSKVASGAIVSEGGKSVGASWGDYDNDGDLDLFVANSGNQNNFLYANNGDGTFSKVSSGIVVNNGGDSHGSAWGDYDNDGDLDLVVTNDGPSNNFLYSNDGNGNFTAVDNNVTTDGGNSFGVAFADYNNDGDLDIFIANHEDGSVNFLYENERGSCSSNACVALVGTNSNAAAIGAKVELLATIRGQARWQTRYVTAQSGGGLGGQNDMRLHFGLGDAAQVDSIIVTWPSGYVQYLGSQSANNCLSITEDNGSKICGVAYHDENGNCQYDDGETLLANARIRVQPGDLSAYTNEAGAYAFTVPPGTYTVEEVSISKWDLVCPASVLTHTVTVTEMGAEYCQKDFGHQPSGTCPSQPDLEVSMATTAARVGFESLTAIQYKNTGTAKAYEVTLAVDFGPHIKPLESSRNWDSIENNVYYWTLDSLAIGTNQTIFIKDSVLTTATIGDTATLMATLLSPTTDCNTNNDVHRLEEEFTGAIDPNDILVNPQGPIKAHQQLTYRIRFQNVGNAPVETVRLEDELPEELDLESLELGIASHSYRFFVEDDRRLVWLFENIQLPDSTSNEVESHGFVTFRLRPAKDLEPGTTIDNQALIFFDSQAPVATNTVRNIIRPNGGEAPGQLSLAPNPMSDYSEVTIYGRRSGEVIGIQSVMIYSLTGELLLTRTAGGADAYRLEEESLQAGYYTVQAVGMDGKLYLGKLLIH
ncbi:MAG: CRTAC1 family protein [Bacteroidota bacterium]